VQFNTLSHILLDGMSTLHPFVVDDAKADRLDSAIADPYHELKRVLKWYDGAVDRINSFVAADPDSYRYDKAISFVRLKWSLERSATRSFSLLERRRIARLTDRSYDEFDAIDTFNGERFVLTHVVPDWLTFACLHSKLDVVCR
jgi:hypothetical protein